MKVHINKILKTELESNEKITIIGVIISLLFLMFVPFIILGDFKTAFQTLINGFLFSSLYIGVSIGFSLIFGIAKQFKLSIGGYFVLSAYLMFFLLESIKIVPDLNFINSIQINLTNVFSLNFENLIVIKDPIFFLLIVLIPLISSILILIYLFKVFEKKLDFMLIFLAFIIISVGVLYRSSSSKLVMTYVIFVSFSFILVILACYYVEFSQKRISVFSIPYSIVLFLIYYLFPNEARYLVLMIITIMIVALIAMIDDRYLLDRIRHSNVDVMIVTFALALILQSFVQIFYYPRDGERFFQFGVEQHSLATLVGGYSNFFGISLENFRIVALIFIFIAVIGLFVFLKYSKIGLAMKAVAQDEQASALVGINIRKITTIVSGLGIGLVALSAILTSPFSNRPYWGPYMGWSFLILAIAVVTLGGMGSLVGTAIASFIVGYTTAFVGSIEPSLVSIVPLIVIIIIMLIKPNGLFGKNKELE
jgi:branched-chain amino acid transport system permease protein